MACVCYGTAPRGGISSLRCFLKNSLTTRNAEKKPYLCRTNDSYLALVD